MSSNRLFTPIAAGVVAGVFVVFAAIGGSVTSDNATVAKADRFAGIGDTLCASQSQPNLSSECLAWSENEIAEGTGRYVTVASSDAETGITTLNRIEATSEAF